MKLLVVGTGRSGTTLLQRVLSSHPDISMVRETFFYSIINQNHKFNKKNYYNSKVIIKYLKRYWWMHEIIDDWDSFENFYNSHDKVSRNDDSIFFSILNYKKNNAKVIGEKTPEHFRNVTRMLDTYNDICVIGITRSPYDILNSYKNIKNGPSYPSLVLKDFMEFCDISSKLKCNKRFKLINYEDLTSSPDKVLDSIQKFLNIRPLNLNSSDYLNNRLSYSPEQTHHVKSNNLIVHQPSKKMNLKYFERYVINYYLNKLNKDNPYHESFSGSKYIAKFFYTMYLFIDILKVNTISRFNQYIKIFKIKKRQKDENRN